MDGIFAISFSVVEVGDDVTDSRYGCQEQYAGRFCESPHYVFAKRFDGVRNKHAEHYQQEVVGHLHVVGVDLQRHEEGCDNATP